MLSITSAIEIFTGLIVYTVIEISEEIIHRRQEHGEDQEKLKQIIEVKFNARV